MKKASTLRNTAETYSWLASNGIVKPVIGAAIHSWRLPESSSHMQSRKSVVNIVTVDFDLRPQRFMETQISNIKKNWSGVFYARAYCNGYFPMADSKREKLGWVLVLTANHIRTWYTFHIPRSLKLHVWRKKPLDIRINKDFDQKLMACVCTTGRNMDFWGLL